MIDAGDQGRLPTLLFGVGAICLVIVVGFLFRSVWVDWVVNKLGGSSEQIQPSLSQQELSRAGDYKGALERYKEVLQNNSSNPTETAKATLFIGVAKFKISQDVADYLQHVRDLKSIVMNPVVDARTRGLALTVIASMYCGSGRTPVVFGEIYSGEPFSKYLVPGDPNLSSRNLHGWAAEIYPNAKNSVRIARWYAEELLWDSKLTDAKRQEYKGVVEKYIKEADRLALSETQGAQSGNFLENYLTSESYTAYHYWRAIEIAGLAVVFGGTYKEQYKAKFSDFFKLIDSQHSDVTAKYTPYARMFYAYFLWKIDNDKVAAQDQLRQAIQLTQSDPRPGSNPFLLFLHNEGSKPAWDFSSQVIYDMMAISPEFKSFVASIK